MTINHNFDGLDVWLIFLGIAALIYLVKFGRDLTDAHEYVSNGWIRDYDQGRNYLRRTLAGEGDEKFRSVTFRPDPNGDKSRYKEEIKR